MELMAEREQPSETHITLIDAKQLEHETGDKEEILMAILGAGRTRVRSKA